MYEKIPILAVNIPLTGTFLNLNLSVPFVRVRTCALMLGSYLLPAPEIIFCYFLFSRDTTYGAIFWCIRYLLAGSLLRNFNLRRGDALQTPCPILQVVISKMRWNKAPLSFPCCLPIIELTLKTINLAVIIIGAQTAAAMGVVVSGTTYMAIKEYCVSPRPWFKKSSIHL